MASWLDRVDTSNELVRSLVEACGRPQLVKTLAADERERARGEGRILWVGASNTMGDREASFGFLAPTEPVNDEYIVFETPIPNELRRVGYGSGWEYVNDVHAAFGLERPNP